MANKMIIGSKLTPLALGRPVNSDKYDISGFMAETDGIQPGAFLVYGTDTKRYKTVGTDTTPGGIAGIYVKPLAKSHTTWPGGNEEPVLKEGEHGDVLIRGDVAIRLGDAEAGNPAEGGKVYLQVAAGPGQGHAFSTAATGRIELVGYIYLGINGVDGNGKKLAAVRRLY